MPPISRNFIFIGIVAAAYTATYALNDWLFKEVEFTQGVAWVYLPAGIRLICTLLLGEIGVIGILLGSLITSTLFKLFPNDLITTVGYSLISALAPYFAYRFTLQELRLERNLTNLTTTNLLICILLYGLCNPVLQLLWFVVRRVSTDFLPSMIVMSIGDLTGSLVVVYAIKFLLSFVKLPAR